jgi:ankyrin repeat protein
VPGTRAWHLGYARPTRSAAPGFWNDALKLVLVACQTSSMDELQAALIDAVEADSASAVRAAVAAGADVNARSYEGASVLYVACLRANPDVVRTLLDLGADPNLRSEPPSDEVFDRTPLDTVKGARFLMDWDRYDPIYELLVSRGATDTDGHVEEAADRATSRGRALLWQEKGVAWGEPTWLRWLRSLRRPLRNKRGA